MRIAKVATVKSRLWIYINILMTMNVAKVCTVLDTLPTSYIGRKNYCHYLIHKLVLLCKLGSRNTIYDYKVFFLSPPSYECFKQRFR